MIEFDGKDFARALRQARRHFTVARANFHPYAFVHAHVTRDAFLPACIREKMLSQLLGRHEREVYQEQRSSARDMHCRMFLTRANAFSTVEAPNGEI
jgi:hypothetical protein